MRQVFVLDTFEDIEKAFNGVRGPDDKTPMMEEKAKLNIHGDTLTLESENFVLGEHVRSCGNRFVLHCISRVLGKKFSADKINT